jgi:hypothetical protein
VSLQDTTGKLAEVKQKLGCWMSKQGNDAEKGEYYGSNEEEEGMRYRDYEYNSSSIDDIIAENSLTDFSFEAIDFDTKFRSMQALDSTLNPFDGASLMTSNFDGQSIPSFQGSNKPEVSVTTAKRNEPILTFETIPLNVPEKPFYIGPSQFLCTLSLIELLTTLQMKLNSIFEISYIFHQESCHVRSPLLLRCSFFFSS